MAAGEVAIADVWNEELLVLVQCVFVSAFVFVDGLDGKASHC